MKKTIIALEILIIFLIALKAWGFSFGGGGFGLGTVPVTDSQLNAVNSALDAIETTLAEELKNINTNIYNLLRLQYENFFEKNYQDKILKIWDLKDRIEDYQTLLKDLSDKDNQTAKLHKYIEMAELAGAYKTITELPDLISCLPEDKRFLAEEYISSTFAYYDLSQYALSQLSLIPACEEIYPNFGAGVISQRSIPQPKGFFSGLFANILKPLSLGNFMLAEGPGSVPPLATISIVSGYNETAKNFTIEGFVGSVGSHLNKNIQGNLKNIPDPRDVVIPVNQVRTDSGKPIILEYKTLVSFSDIYAHQQRLREFIERSFSNFDLDLALSTTTFATASSATSSKNIPEICKNLTTGDAKPLNPQIACADAAVSSNAIAKDITEKKLENEKKLAEDSKKGLEEANQKIDNLENSPTTTACQGYKERIAELKQEVENRLVHIATVTIDINEAINKLTGININQEIETISSTRAYINKEYRDIISKVNEILTTFKLKGIKGRDIFGPLPLDFLGEIMTKLSGHNAILSLTKIDEVMTKVDQIFKSAGNIASAVGQSREIFDDLRLRLRNAAKPISNSVLVKDYFEIYGIQVELAKMEKDLENGCRSQVAKRNQQRFYSLKGNNNYFSLDNFQRNNRITLKKIQPIQQQKTTERQNFFQKLMAKIFAVKILEVNLK